MLTEQQLQERRHYLGGSDSAIVCGYSPFKTPLALWMEKTGRIEPDDLSGLDHIKFGNYFEDGVAQWFAAESGKALVTGSQPTLFHKDYPWMAANIDRFILGENAILECKTAFNDDDWGNGENKIPMHYLLQVAHYCAVGNFDRAYIAVVFATKRQMRYYVYDRDLNLENKLIARLKQFWEEYVLKDEAPPAVNEQDVLLLHKETLDAPIMATDVIEGLLATYQNAQASLKYSKDVMQETKDKIALYMQNHETLIDNHGKVLATWRYTKPRRETDLKKLEAEYPQAYEACRKTGAPQRRFKVTGVEDE